jgi:asparaginyl-tRNA synthetase
MFNKRIKIAALLASDNANYQATVMGWVRTFRNNQFIALNDGSTNNNIQIVAELGKFDDALLKRLTTGACIKATGEVIASLGKGQKVELKATEIEILGDSDAEKFPLQPKKHSLEFLREIAHLRFRTNTFSAVFRIRHWHLLYISFLTIRALCICIHPSLRQVMPKVPAKCLG